MRVYRFRESSPGAPSLGPGLAQADQQRQRQHVGQRAEQVVAPPNSRSTAAPGRSRRRRRRAARRGCSAAGPSARRSPAPPRSGPGRWTGLRSSCPGRTARARRRRRRRMAPPEAVAAMRMPLSRLAERARGVGRVADHAHQQADAGVGEGPVHRERQHDADRQQRVDLQRRLHRRLVAPAAERDRRQSAAPAAGSAACRGRTPGPMPSSISAMPVAMSLTRGSEHSRPCSSAEQRAGQRRAATHAEPRRAGAGRRRRRPPCADSTSTPSRPRLMRPDFSVRHLAEADEQEGRADADRAADDAASSTIHWSAGHAALLIAVAARCGMRSAGFQSTRAAPRSPGSARRRCPAAPAPTHRAGRGGAAAGCRRRRSRRTGSPPG